MSLRIFHIIFIICSTAIALGFAVWAFAEFQRASNAAYLIAGLSSIGAGLALTIYGRRFAKKMKGIV